MGLSCLLRAPLKWGCFCGSLGVVLPQGALVDGTILVEVGKASKGHDK